VSKSSVPVGMPRLVRFWRSARGYWSARGPRCAWLVTLSLAAVVCASLGITWGINVWNRHFFDALEARNGALALHEGIKFPLLVALYLVLCVFAMWARMTLQRTWRVWINAELLRRWLAKSRFYKLELIPGDHANPEHRINDDLRVATEMPVDFVTGFATSLLSAVTFVVVLWTVGGALTLDIGGSHVTIPGFLVIAAVLYALVANGAMLAAAFRFIALTQQKNQAEAEYRYALTRVRENAESIALLAGGEAERDRLGGVFSTVVVRWRDLMVQHMRAVIVSQGSAQLCGVVPILLCTPRYLDGTMTLGAVMQASSAFAIVQGALSWFMENYTRLGDWTASARRVAALMAALDATESGEPARVAAAAAPERAALRLRNVGVARNDGRAIVRGASATVWPGERVLLTGESGSGKSSLLRALAGCWPWTSGEIACGEGLRLAVVPQRAYVPPGTLRAALAYPHPPAGGAAEEDALAAVGLPHFIGEIDTPAAWDRILSAGEKQRVAIARVLLRRPAIVVLDEATSALQVAAQADLMALIARELPGATIVSVGHRPELEAFHDRKISIARRPDGSIIVGDAPIREDAAGAKASA
jgi:vitamin B12/bleomycin/antimicrobial peptide transport system ATP-binding/permease protein